MEIKSNLEDLILDEYDFVFTNGNVLPITLDTKAGDTISFNKDTIVIVTVAKPNPMDPRGEVGDNTTTINRSHIMFWEYRQRKQMAMTPEQRIEMQNTIKKLAADPRKLSPTVN